MLSKGLVSEADGGKPLDACTLEQEGEGMSHNEQGSNIICTKRGEDCKKRVEC